MSGSCDGAFRVRVLLPAEPAVTRVQTPGPMGADAYAIWLTLGNVGTPAEFLASLHGQDGDTGPQGPPGIEPDLPDLSLLFENGLV